MANKFEAFLSTASKDIVSFLGKLAGVAAKFEKVIAAEKKLTPEFIADAKLLVADAIAVAGAVSSAMSTKGANWTSDVAAVKAVEKLATDTPAFVKGVEDAVAALESAVS
jgi:hypothetical protein